MDAVPQVDDFDIAKAISEKLRGLPKEKQERILRWVTEGIGLSTSASSSFGTAVHQGGTETGTGDMRSTKTSSNDIKTFVTLKSPKSDQQFAATVAYYYRFEAAPADRHDLITGEILQEAARLAGRKRLGNPRTTLNNAKQAGYLDSGSPGEFAISSVGENLVAMTLPGGTNGAGPMWKKPKDGRKKKSRKARR